MATNQILPFAITDTGSNLVTQAEYSVDQHRLTGNQPGVARSQLVNKALKQSTLMASGLGEFMARHAVAGAADVADTMTPEAVADYLTAVVNGLGGSGLPPGGEAGQVLVKRSDAEGDAGWQQVAGVPVGTVIPYAGRKAPPGFLSINYEVETYVPVEAYQQLVEAVWCGEEENDEADFFYRCNASDGSGRHAEGDWLALPAASKYFLRGRDAGGEVSAYQYQGDAIRNMEGRFTLHEMHVGSDTATGVFSQESQNVTNVGARGILVSCGTETFLFDASCQVPTAEENRPINFPVMWCIRAYDGYTDPAALDVQVLANSWQEMVAARLFESDFTGGNQLLEENGYQILPGGLIMQWCWGAKETIAKISSVTQTLTLPLTFPNACLGVFPASRYVSDARIFTQDSGFDNAAVTLKSSNVGGQSGTHVPGLMAIGY